MTDIRLYRIILPANAVVNERRAAELIRKAVRLVSGISLPVLTDQAPSSPYELIVGETSREREEGISFTREADRTWEYEIRTVGTHVYLTGLGTEPEERPFNTAYRTYRDRGCGTVYAAYRFSEDILGYSFADAAWEPFRAREGIGIPDHYNVSFTKEWLFGEMPERMSDPALYTVPCGTHPEWNMGCLIFRDPDGRFVLLDGGFEEDAEHLVRILEFLSCGEKPVIGLWLFSHIDPGHTGFYNALCDHPELARRICVERICGCIPEASGTGPDPETVAFYHRTRGNMLNCSALTGAEFCEARTDNEIRMGDLTVEILLAPERNTPDDPDEACTVYRLHYAGTTLMLLGNAGWKTSQKLAELPPEKLRSDVVQVAQHGKGHFSGTCYRKIGARAALWQTSAHTWYGDDGEGLNTRNTGIMRTGIWLRAAGCDSSANFRNSNGILNLRLPIQKTEK